MSAANYVSSMLAPYHRESWWNMESNEEDGSQYRRRSEIRFTLCLHCGGKFHTGIRSRYVGGKEIKVHNFSREVFTLNVLQSVVRNHGGKEPFRLYKYVKDGFLLLSDDNDLSKLYEEKLKNDRVIDLYIDELPPPDNPSPFIEHVNNVESHEESEDLEFGISDLEFDEDLDDEWFAENVDPDVEWFGVLPNQGDSLENTGENEEAKGSEISEDDVVQSDDNLDSGKDSDGDLRGDNFPVFNTEQIYNPSFELGMLFTSKGILRQAVHSLAIKTNRTIKIVKNDNRRLYAKCGDISCKWHLHGLKVRDELAFQIRELNPKHTCVRSFHVKNMNANWISGKYMHKFKSDPNRNIKGFRVDAIEETKCHISRDQVYRAKRKAIDTIQGECSEQYNFLWDFAEEVRRSNPGSTVILSTDEAENGDKIFSRFYMCLHAVKKGFVSGCRPFVGIDGCHLKGPHEGVLLCAVGVDPNNNIYPLALAVVPKENTDTWEWFMTLLKIDLKISNDYEWTFMSDKQKGLIITMDRVFPGASHRFCVRHLHENFKSAGFRGQEFKSALWKAARASTVNEFRRRMEGMKAIDENAYKWFNDKPPEQWSRAFFNDISKCDMLLNNGCETFNSNILDARDKPIVSMLEWILEHFMKRMHKNRKRGNKWKGILCPKIQEIIDNSNEKMGDCIPIKSDDSHYQINCFDGSKYAVDLKERTCGCRKWELSGIPCMHALSAINNEGLLYFDFTHTCYRLDTYKKVYEPVVMPINGRSEWTPTGFIPPLPPNDGRDVGRPKMARKKANDEPSQKLKKRSRGKPIKYKLQRQQKTVKCSECGLEGHNKTSCRLVSVPLERQVSTALEQQEEIPVSWASQVAVDTESSHRPTKVQEKCSERGLEGHNKTSCPFVSAPLVQRVSTPLEQQEEIVVSQYMASQVAEMESSHRPPKIKVKRKVSTQKSLKKSWQATFTTGKCVKPPPKPFQQLEEGQVDAALKKKEPK